ncbi:enoyl-CoA hydratase/isomerase family protein [Henriciella sp.]|uniref:enoyl-CoA hydratase/isomerase family protein n=1 Tax=Henriciella sp. TaxID=1968823 RepID=UPI00260FD9BB|nr:enoyl-CoA hydratase/isomerase family protein [Henriciella sp.]
MAVSISERSGTLWLTLFSPPVNAITLDLVQDLAQIVEGTQAEHPIVLTGKGKSFSAGVDTRAFESYSSDQRRELVLGITRMVKALVCHPAPVIAAVNGHAIGGGLVLALTADYRISCAADAKFGLPEAKAGIPFPAGAAEVIRHELPGHLLRNLSLTSRVTTQDELHAERVFDHVCKPDELPVVTAQALRTFKAAPAFTTVKQQARGELQARLRALVSAGDDPFMSAFGVA